MNRCFDVFSIVFKGHIESRIFDSSPPKDKFGMLDFLLPQNATYNPVNRRIRDLPKAFGIGGVRGAPYRGNSVGPSTRLC